MIIIKIAPIIEILQTGDVFLYTKDSELLLGNGQVIGWNVELRGGMLQERLDAEKEGVIKPYLECKKK